MPGPSLDPKCWSDAVRSHYDLMAGLYRRYWGDHIHHGLFLRGDEAPERAQLRMLDYCAALVRPQRGWAVMDVGCGHGGTAMYLARRFASRVTGLTISPQQASLAARNGKLARLEQQVGFEVADVAAYSFPFSHYDLLWTMESSEHFVDKPGYFLNASYTLKPGGQLLVAAWTGTMTEPAVREVARLFLCPSLQPAAEYVRQIEAAGMRVAAAYDLTAYVWPTWEICARRVRPVQWFLPHLPQHIRSFVAGIDVISGAYRSGALTYTVIAAQKPLGAAPAC